MTTMTAQGPSPSTPADTPRTPTTPTATAAAASAGPAAHLAARRNLALPTIYAGSFGAFVGIAIADVAYPLLVLGFTGKPLLAGLFGTIQFAALVLCALPAGSFADRHDRRRILIGGECVRALLSTVLAVSLASGHVSLLEVYLIAAILGACQPFSGVRTLALRKLAPADRLIKVLAVQQGVSSVAQLVGPALGTLLYSVGRSLPFAAIAAGMAVSALCAYFVRFDARPEPAPAEVEAASTTAATSTSTASSDGRKRGGGGGAAGLGIVWNNPVMRATLVFVMLVNLVAMPLDLVVIVQARHEGVPTHLVGLILACAAGGGLLGAPLIPKLHARLRPGRLLTAFGAVVSLACFAMALPSNGLLLAAGMAAIGFAIPAAVVLVDVLILQQVPDHQRGRVLGAVNTLVALGLPLGSAFGGSLLQLFSPATVCLGIACGLCCVTLYAAAQRDLRRANWPTDSARR
jgi:MFS family permease